MASFRGRMLCPPDALAFVLVGHVPDAGYAIRLATGELYRNGEHQGRAIEIRYDADVRGIWVEYEALPGSSMYRLAPTSVSPSGGGQRHG